jgi:hypothetical protein
MALTDFEKDCIDEIFAACTPKDRRRPSPAQQADLDTIKHGSEADRQTLIRTYITDVGLDKVAIDITTHDDEIALLTAAKVALQAKQTAMQNY